MVWSYEIFEIGDANVNIFNNFVWFAQFNLVEDLDVLFNHFFEMVFLKDNFLVEDVDFKDGVHHIFAENLCKSLLDFCKHPGTNLSVSLNFICYFLDLSINLFSSLHAFVLVNLWGDQ